MGLALLFASCGGSGHKTNASNTDELTGTISISGAFALEPLVRTWADEFQQLHPGVKIDVSTGGAGKGMTDVLSNLVDLGMVSREIYPPEQEKGALGFAVAKDAVVPTINVNNPILAELLNKGLSRETAIKLWITQEYKTWGQVLGTSNKTAAHVYTRSDACGAAETWALWLGKKQEDLKGTAVFGDPGLAKAVQDDKLGIGLNNLSYAYDDQTHLPNTGIIVLPVDGNNDGQITEEERFYDTKDDIIAAIAADKYPSPPARDLYLVTKGLPQNQAVVEFLKYILTDGQQHNVPVGYIGLSEEKLQKGLDLLKNEGK